MTYPPQPPDPYGQQYPPPPPQPGYGQQQYPPAPPPNPYQQQAPYPQQQPQPYPQQQPYPPQPGQFGQQPPGMYPGGMPPQPPRNNGGKVLLIVLGVVVVLGLGIGGVVWFTMANSPKPVSVGTSTTLPTVPTTSRRTTTSTPGTGSGGATGTGEATPEEVQSAYINAVNGKVATEALALTCARSHDELATAIAAPDSIFAANAHVIATPGAVTKNGTSADMAGKYAGTVAGKPFNRDFSLPMEQISGRWYLCDH